MARRAVVDLRFPARLRQLRVERGLSLRDLSRAAYVGKSTISELENAQASPSAEMAAHLDRVLEAGGELASLVTQIPVDPEAEERIAYAVARPARLDRAAVRAFAGVLAAERRLDDAVVAHALLPSVESQWGIVLTLAQDARGPYAGGLRAVVAEWTQFVGWLHAEARHDAKAVRILIEAARQADAVDDGVLAAQAENFRGYLERQRRNPRGIVRHFRAAYHTRGASVLQRIGDAVQAAYGLALLGDRQSAERLLAEASNMSDAVDGQPAPVAAYWLSPMFHRLSIGLAHLGLENHTEAADNLRAGLAGLPPGSADAEWAAEYRDALVEAETPR